MADSFIFDHGPNGHYLTTDASGRIIATVNPYGAFYEYGYGDTGRAVVVDASGRIGVNVNGQMNTAISTAPVNVSINSATKTLNLSQSNVFKLTWGDNASASTLTFSNPQAGGKYTFLLVNNNGASGAVNFPASVKWSGGNPMKSLTAASGAEDVVGMTYIGTNFYAASGCNFS